MNTLNWGLQRARQKYSIRHTEKIREHVHQARRVLDLSIDYYKQFKDAGDHLACQRFSEVQLRRVLDELYPSGTDDVASDRTRRSRDKTKQRITELFARGDTQGNAPGTKWAAVNAVIDTPTGSARSTAGPSASPAPSTTAHGKPKRWRASQLRSRLMDRLDAKL